MTDASLEARKVKAAETRRKNKERDMRRARETLEREDRANSIRNAYEELREEREGAEGIVYADDACWFTTQIDGCRNHVMALLSDVRRAYIDHSQEGPLAAPLLLMPDVEWSYAQHLFVVMRDGSVFRPDLDEHPKSALVRFLGWMRGLGTYDLSHELNALYGCKAVDYDQDSSGPDGDDDDG